MTKIIHGFYYKAKLQITGNGSMQILKSTTRLIGLVMIAITLSACSNDKGLSAEDQVMTVVKNIEESIENRDTSDVFKHVSEHYKDHKGNDKKGLRRLAMAYLLRSQNMVLINKVQSINSLNDTTVALELSSVIASNSNQENALLPSLSANRQQFSAVFGLEGQEWKLISLSWQNTPTI